MTRSAGSARREPGARADSTPSASAAGTPAAGTSPAGARAVGATPPVAGAPALPGAALRRRSTGFRRSLTAAPVVVLLAVVGFLLWSAQATASRAEHASAASRLSTDYRAASTAITDEQSLAREYFLRPSPAVRTEHAQAGIALVTALGRIEADGATADSALAQTVLARHEDYSVAVDALFAAMDSGAGAAVVARLGTDRVDPLITGIKATVDARAAQQQQAALDQLDSLGRVAGLLRMVIPVVFGVGFLLIAGFSTVTRRYRRERDTYAAENAYATLHDALTGLPNRVLLDERLGQELLADARRGTRCALLLLDLDRFKELNDTLGHSYGDLLLTLIGPRLRRELRALDTVARLGGDEFAVLLPDVHDTAGAMEVTGRLCQALAEPFDIVGAELDVDVSIGIAVSGEHGGDAATLLQHADVAMYVAKALGVPATVYDPDADGHSTERLALLGDLRRGLERDELVMYYQPKVSLSTGDVVGAEALVRWQHPERGLIGPDDFIPLAERTGLMGRLTRYVLDAALAQARRWNDDGMGLPVAVNISARNLVDDHLPETVAARLLAHGLPASFLIVEVTESAVITDPVRARRLLNDLHSLGVKISLDDFGAGYTSLAQLKTLPLSELKIDRSLIASLAQDPGSAVIVQSVIDLSHNLGLAAVAEGIETHRDWQALAGTGCDVGQGYFLSRPVPAEQFATWCRQFRSQSHRAAKT